MSGIYGIYRYGGGPVDPRWLERMREAMAYYGPNGGSCKVEGPVGIGHLLLEVNPEDAYESQPVCGERGLVVSAARLDNRDALLDAFKIPASEAPQVADGHLVSLAFDKWGEEVCSHLEGDWALAAWDSRERRLLMARDACGNSSLYYYEGNRFMAFASSLKALLALPGTAKGHDELSLVEVLVNWQHDAELTAYKGFRRLLGAQTLVVGPEGRSRIGRYWSAEGHEPLRYRREEDYEEAFLEHYNRAVQGCLRTQRPVAAMLSSGRDSSSVVSLAARLLAFQGRTLTAYTSVPCMPPDGARQHHLGNEWDLAHAAARMAGANVRHIAIDAADYRILQGMDHFLDIHDGPSCASGNHYWLQAISETAARNGAGVVLTGQMGNATVSWGGNGSALLALLQGDPQTAMQLLLHAEQNPWQIMRRQVLKPLLTPILRFSRRLKSPNGEPWREYSAVNPRMAAKLGLDRRMRAAGFDPTYTISPLVDTQTLLFEPYYRVAFQIWSEMSAWHGVSFLDPTANLKLAEFLLRVPDSQFRRNGQDSSLFRRSLRGRLPERILEGKQKGLQSADAGHRVLKELPAIRQCLASLSSLPAANDFLDLPLLDRCLQDLIAKVDPDTTRQASAILLRGLEAGRFLLRLS